MNKEYHNYFCEKCNYKTVVKQAYQKHLRSNKHKKKNKKSLPDLSRMYSCKYECKCCKIYLSSNSEARRHIKTKKHKRNKGDKKNMIIENPHKTKI